MLATVALVTAVPAPQFQQPRQVAPEPQQPKNINPDAEQLEGSNDEKDLKGSASYGYGYYGGLGHYGGYGGYGGYGYPYSYSYGYPSYGFGYYGNCKLCLFISWLKIIYQMISMPAYPYYRGFGGLYGGYYY